MAARCPVLTQGAEGNSQQEMKELQSQSANSWAQAPCACPEGNKIPLLPCREHLPLSGLLRGSNPSWGGGGEAGGGMHVYKILHAFR